MGTLEKRQEKKLESPVGNQSSFIEIYIMKKSILLFSLLGMLMITGCATKGRISLIDLDLRTPEQIIERTLNEIHRVLLPRGIYFCDEFSFNKEVEFASIGKFNIYGSDEKDYLILKKK